MAEIVIIARRTFDHPDQGIRDRQWAVGHFVEILPDGTRQIELANPASMIKMPRFGWLLLPNVPISVVRKYIQANKPDDNDPIARRIWRLRYSDLPLATRNKFIANGGCLTIKVAAYYSGSEYDYTWAQVKGYIYNAITQLNETEEP